MARVNGLFHARQKWSVIWSSYFCTVNVMLYSFNHCATTAASKMFDVFLLLQTCQHIPDLFSVQVSFFHTVNPVGERLSWTRLQQGPDSSDIQSYYSVYAALYFFSTVTVTQQPPTPTTLKIVYGVAKKDQSQQRRVFGHRPGMFSITTRRSHISLAPPRS